MLNHASSSTVFWKPAEKRWLVWGPGMGRSLALGTCKGSEKISCLGRCLGCQGQWAPCVAWTQKLLSDEVCPGLDCWWGDPRTLCGR